MVMGESFLGKLGPRSSSRCRFSGIGPTELRILIAIGASSSLAGLVRPFGFGPCGLRHRRPVRDGWLLVDLRRQRHSELAALYREETRW